MFEGIRLDAIVDRPMDRLPVWLRERLPPLAIPRFVLPVDRLAVLKLWLAMFVLRLATLL